MGPRARDASHADAGGSAVCGYRNRDVVVWRSSDLHLAKPGVVDGIPVVGVARALLDVSDGRTPDEVLRLAGACRRHLPMSIGALVEALHLHARSGRPGIAVFRQALAGLGSQVPASEFERLVLRDLLSAGVRPPSTNHILRLGDADPMELDLAWLAEKVDLELDGADHVDRPLRRRRDRRRDRILQRHGWLVARYGWDDYVGDRDGMIAEIAATVDERRRQLG